MEGVLRQPAFIAVALVFVVIEAIWRLRTGRGYDWAGAFASLGVAIGNTVLRPLNGADIAGALGAAYLVSPVKLPVDDWRVWIVAFFAVEFCYYWFHRWSHTIRWMWASHAVHHSATEFGFTAAIRLGWTGALSGGWIAFVPLALCGFHPLMIGGFLAANLAYQFFLHTEAVERLGPLEWVFNTPAHHRVHHACNPEFLDKNFGGVLIIFDRMFGTLGVERPGARLRYGLASGFRSANPIKIAFHEWAVLWSHMARETSLRRALLVALSRPNDASHAPDRKRISLNA